MTAAKYVKLYIHVPVAERPSREFEQVKLMGQLAALIQRDTGHYDEGYKLQL